MASGQGLAVSWLDVFTDRAFAGNPLAVVPDGDEVAEPQMQALARELGLSETVFVTDGGRRLRIFTPTMELPLAGHPTVGAAVELARLGRIEAEGVTTFETGAGPIDVECSAGSATMTQAAPRLGGDIEPGRAAGLLQLDRADVVGQPAFCTTTGVGQAFVQVRDRETLAGIRPDLDAVCTLAGADGVGAWCEHDGGLAQRFFAPQMGINEDPATGSAAGALAALRVFQGAEPGTVVVRQGDEIRRPSTINVDVPGEPGAPGPPRVGGTAVLVLEATVPAATLAALA
jgi:trans-2,3-dihydro-3-hydroxyanthranilate isomerase